MLVQGRGLRAVMSETFMRWKSGRGSGCCQEFLIVADRLSNGCQLMLARPVVLLVYAGDEVSLADSFVLHEEVQTTDGKQHKGDGP